MSVSDGVSGDVDGFCRKKRIDFDTYINFYGGGVLRTPATIHGYSGSSEVAAKTIGGNSLNR